MGGIVLCGAEIPGLGLDGFADGILVHLAVHPAVDRMPGFLQDGIQHFIRQEPLFPCRVRVNLQRQPGTGSGGFHPAFLFQTGNLFAVALPDMAVRLLDPGEHVMHGFRLRMGAFLRGTCTGLSWCCGYRSLPHCAWHGCPQCSWKSMPRVRTFFFEIEFPCTHMQLPPFVSHLTV